MNSIWQQQLENIHDQAYGSASSSSTNILLVLHIRVRPTQDFKTDNTINVWWFNISILLNNISSKYLYVKQHINIFIYYYMISYLL